MVLRSMWGTLVGRMFSVGKAVLMVGISLGALSRAFVALMNNVVGIRRDVLSFFFKCSLTLVSKNEQLRTKPRGIIQGN